MGKASLFIIDNIRNGKNKKRKRKTVRNAKITS